MLAFVLALASVGAPDPDPRPNVVLILVDDLGWADLGCQGSRTYETPHIDRLAAQGMRFSAAYASAAVCSPTRAALMTGRHPARLHITDWIRARFQASGQAAGAERGGYLEPDGKPLAVPAVPLRLELEEVTLAEELARAGYRTAHVGKWHLGREAWYPEHQGFDENHGGCDFGQPPSYFDPYANARVEGIPTLAPRREGQYLTEREAQECVSFLRRNRERPFFLYYAPYAVHTPIQGEPERVAYYRAKLAADPALTQRNAEYAAMVHAVDLAVGRILDTLEELELVESTLVIFTSDNGGLLGPTDNAPLRLGKGYPYEGGIRVPLLVRYPDVIPAGATSAAPVASMDLLPTVLEACGVERSGTEPLDGRSLWTHCLSAGQRSLERDMLVWHFPHYRSADITPFSVLRVGEAKLVHWWDGPRTELYDLGTDLAEAHDLAEARPDEVVRMLERLEAELEALDAELPRRRAPR